MNNRILGPVFALVALTFVVVLRLAFVRFRALARREVSPSYFRVLQGDPPAQLLPPARNLINLFEFPVLFYGACLIVWAGRLTDGHYVLLGWLYVGLRAAHSAIQLTFNDPRLRFPAFALSLTVLGLFWIRLFIRLS